MPPAYPPSYDDLADQPKKSKTGLIIGLCAGGAVLLIAIVLLLIKDPLGIFGGSTTVAQAVPQNVDFYASIDLLKMMDQNTIDTITAFTRNTDSDIANQEDLIDQMDQDLDDSYGVTFSEDIKPWIGTSAAFFVNNLKDTYSGVSNDPEVTLVVLVRDTSSADRFIKKMKAGIKDKQDAEVEDTRYQNVTIYSFQDEYDSSTLAFARSGKVFLVSNTLEGIKAAIDAQKGDSLAKEATFQQLMKVLPSDGAVNLYIPSSTVSTLMDEGADMSSLSYGSFVAADFYKASAMSVSFEKAGVAIESAVAYDLDAMSNNEKILVQSSEGASRLVKDFPEDTLFFIGGSHLDLAWAAYHDMLVDAVGQSDFDQAMSMVEESAGFNPDKDLLPIMDGQYAMGIFADQNGLLAELAEAKLGIQMIFESSNSDRLRSYSADISDLLTASDVSVDHNSSGAMDTWDVSEPYLEMDLFSFGVNDDALILSTDTHDMHDAFDRSSSLEDSSTFKNAWSSIGNGMTPVFYMDFPALLNAIIETPDADLTSEDVAVLKPIQTIVMGISKLQGNIQQSKILITIDKSK
jgi:hypothetical protein